MARAKGPLFSQEASKQLGKTLIFKTKAGKSFITRYNKPGGQNPFTPSTSQTEKRTIYALAVGKWRAMPASLKAYWDESAKEKNLKISGWNLFYKTLFADPEGYLGTSVYGIRLHGYLVYGEKIDL